MSERVVEMIEALQAELRKRAATFEITRGDSEVEDAYIGCADDLAPILAAAREQEQELSAMKEHHSADLREIAEMAIANYGEAIRLSDAGFELVSLPTADSILAEFYEKKGVRK